MKKITKAIIPAAGLGTRMLPISHAVCKEMLPIVDLPAVYHLVEEAAKSGITDVLIITNRDKDAMESFFDLSIEYEKALTAKGKTEEVKRLHEIADMANVYFLRQKETKGLGHAVGRARKFVGDEPFVVLYGDDIVFSKTPVCRQLIDVYEKYGKSVVGVKPVPMEDVRKYSSLKVEKIEGEDSVTYCTDMIEKPKPGEEFSNLSILGRVLLTPDIFDVIDNLEPGAGGEYQLTDAMKKVARESGIYALEFEGDRYDMGSKLGFLMANVRRGLEHPETADAFREYLKSLSETL
ncbi:MAG: UTP--glucose-1-phosphate uridylyltransferase [Clostridia bacterium]|nr:UTP--glucose-1-phosphate uridylyltransferase [Clostridia bacterium]MBO5207644.1 UTP--glucose-1-phosphate uridylyltransferase [Clostridia bacterium]MBP3582805.1 UTP--glucose-1-phosphate uridylyltransferase [Clostridia bacterium]MBQ8584564.1 UTP--glucose-1-phosphate uridylyltransferase [Clostridia bacterium]